MGLYPPLLGVMELEPNSYEWKDIGALGISWLQDAGGFAAVGLLLWFVYVFVTPAPAVASSRRQLVSRFMAVTGALALLVYLVAFGLTLVAHFGGTKAAVAPVNVQPGQIPAAGPQTPLDQAQDVALAIGGLLALLAVCEPLFIDLFHLRGRRIYAIAKLSFKEAVRWRIVWVFFIFLLIFMFPANWFSHRTTKPEDMLKNTIVAVSFTMTLLMVFVALLLTAFSIPTDVKNQTIHTIVTKPVERFEIVMGRFLGYVALLSIALFIMTAASLALIRFSNVDEAARQESMKARVPAYGHFKLFSEKTHSQFAGIDVGREYSYRKYVAGGSSQRAIWEFTDRSDLRTLSDQPVVALEYAFDVYRTTKGLENRGVFCDFDLTTWKWDPTRQDEYVKEIKEKCGGSYPANVRPPSNPPQAGDDVKKWQDISAIAEKYGRYECRAKEVFDYHTLALDVAPGLMKNAIEGSPGKDYPTRVGPNPVLLQVKVKCNSPSQFIGVACLDLYFLESDGSFELNFFKEAVGLWCCLCIAIGLAVASSTYFAGVISFLLSAVLFIGGYFQTYIKGLAAGVSEGGGPLEAAARLVKGTTVAGQLDKTPIVRVALVGDEAYRWMIRRVLSVIPDTDRFAWGDYLEQGFNIRFDFILLNILFMAAYLLPWAVLAYYLMRSREIAA